MWGRFLCWIDEHDFPAREEVPKDDQSGACKRGCGTRVLYSLSGRYESRWDVMSVVQGEPLTLALEESWEPFAVAPSGRVWLRRLIDEWVPE